MSRLERQPGERIDRERTVRFSFDGREVTAYEGDTIASALYASGQRTFSRSFKYHRRRGLLCCAGQCPNCLVQVDDAPGVRSCTEPVREGMKVEHMNARPSLDFDLMRATDLFVGPFTPPGFYYKTFIRPRRLWPLYEKVLRLEREPEEIHARYESWLGSRPEFVADYQRRYAFHGAHALLCWYQCTPVRRRASRIIVAHGDPRTCARLGFMAAANLDAALRKAKESVADAEPSVRVLELPPAFFVKVT